MASTRAFDLFGQNPPRGRSSWGGYSFLLRFWEAILRFPSAAPGLSPRELDLTSLAIASILLDRLEPEDAVADPLLDRWFRIREHAFDVAALQRQLLPPAAEAPQRLGELQRLWRWLSLRLFRAGCLQPSSVRLIAGDLEPSGARGGEGVLEVRAALHAATGVPLWWAIEPALDVTSLVDLMAEPTVGPLVFGKTFPATAFFSDLPFNQSGQAAAAFRGLERTLLGSEAGRGLLFPEDDLAASQARSEVWDSDNRPWTLFANRDDEGLLMGAVPGDATTEGESLPRLPDIVADSAHFFRLLKTDYDIERLPTWLTRDQPLGLESIAVFSTTVALAGLLEQTFVQMVLPDRPMRPETLRTALLRIPIDLTAGHSPSEFEAALVRQNDLAGVVVRRLRGWVT